MNMNILNNNGRSKCLSGFVLTILFFFGIFTIGSCYAAGSAPAISSDQDISSAGFYQISWQTESRYIELEESSQSSFQDSRVIYSGADRAVVISGKPDGRWHYRIRSVDEDYSSPWSEALLVTVKHHDLSRAVQFFFIGLVVFLATFILIFRGTGERKK